MTDRQNNVGFGLHPIKTEGAVIPLEDRIRNLKLCIQQDEELLKQALEALQGLLVFNPTHGELAAGREAVTALRKRLGEKK